MSFLRSTASRSLRFAAPSRIVTRQFSARPTLQASGTGGDYGSGRGDPKGENPQEQGRNPAVDKEHPGPPPPSSAQGGSSSASSSSSSSSKKSSNGASPKIHNESQPSQDSEEVRKHNEEVAKRSDGSKPDPTDEKVDSQFWKGLFTTLKPLQAMLTNVAGHGVVKGPGDDKPK